MKIEKKQKGNWINNSRKHQSRKSVKIQSVAVLDKYHKSLRDKKMGTLKITCLIKKSVHCGVLWYSFFIPTRHVQKSHRFCKYF